MLVTGIADGMGSGKTTVVKKIIENLPADDMAVMEIIILTNFIQQNLK